ncbi:MAG: MFS transporter, partial [Burkholderiales bacterium]
LFYIPLLVWLQLSPRVVPHAKAALRTAKDIAGDLAAALRDVAHNPVILSMTILAAGTSLLVGNAYHAQMPEFAQDLGHGNGDWHYSLLLTAEAVGALTAGIVLESRGLLRAQPRTAIVLAILWSLAIVAFAAVKSYPIAVALLTLAGFLNLAFSAMAQTLVQMHAPPAVRGRVIGLYNMGTLGLRAASGVTVGVLGGMIGIHWSLAGSALLLCVATIVLLAFTPRAARS